MGRELRSKLESVDLVQETLLHALKGLDKFTYTNEGDFVRWLAKIAENELRANVRRLHADKRDIRKEVGLNGGRSGTERGVEGTPEPVEVTTPSVIQSRKEDLARLEKVMNELKPQYREALILAKLEGLSYREIATRLGRSNEAIRKLVSRAMAELAVAFGEVG
jgi:RNA polymerase sigma-70 factor (ECF subfamily)